VNEPNPYSAPQAALETPSDLDLDGFSLEPRRLPVGAGMDWLGKGWQMFSQAPGTWIALMFLLVLSMMVLSVVPFIGGIAATCW
jgi:hypothetical protein